MSSRDRCIIAELWALQQLEGRVITAVLWLGVSYFTLSYCHCHITVTTEQDWHHLHQTCQAPPHAESRPLCSFPSRVILLFELARLSLTLKNEPVADDCFSDLKKMESKVSAFRLALGGGFRRGGSQDYGSRNRKNLLSSAYASCKSVLAASADLHPCLSFHHCHWIWPVLPPLFLQLREGVCNTHRSNNITQAPLTLHTYIVLNFSYFTKSFHRNSVPKPVLWQLGILQ